MKQLSIYDFLELEDDSIYKMLSDLNKGEEILYQGVTIYINEQGFYEFMNKRIHECATDIRKAYKIILDLVI